MEGFQNLEDAESLLNKAKISENDSEIKNLIIKTENSIRELLTTSYPNQPNPSIYKTLNNALNILKEKNQKRVTQTKFSFKNLSKKPVVVPELKVDCLDQPREDHICEPEFTYDENCTIKNFRDKRLFRFLKSKKLGFARIENTENCEIVLINVVDSAFIYNVKKSIIWISIANSSVMIDKVSDSIIITCSRQLRITNSENVKFFVNTVTPPMIDMSKKLSFSINHLSYEGFEDHLEISDLEGDFLENQDLVRDFSWHHANKSPNWESTEKKPEHLTTIRKLNDEEELNKESFLESDWEILKTL